MPLGVESDPFARRHFAGSSGGETVPPWNGSGWNCGGWNCAPGSVPAPCPGSAPPPPPGSTRAPAPLCRQRSKARAAAHTPRRLPWLFLLPIFHALPLPRPCPAAAPMMATACPWSAHRLPRRGSRSPPPATPRPPCRPYSQRTRRPCLAHLLPLPLPDLPTTPTDSPPAPRRQPNAEGVRFST